MLKIDVALLADGVDRRIMLGGIVGVVEQRIDGLIAFEIDDAEALALAHDVDPVLSGGHHLAVMRGARIERAFPQHRCAPQPAWKMRLFSKPRMFSCADSRLGSSAAAGGPVEDFVAHGFARIARGRAQRVRAGVEEDERVHLEAQLDGRAGLGGARIERHRAVIRHRDLAEPVDVGGKIAPAEAVFRGFDQEAVVAVLLPIVAISLIAASPPFRGDRRLGGVAAHRVMPARCVGHDRAEDAAHVRIEAVSFSELEGVLAFQRVRRVVALEQIERVVEQHAGIGAAVEVGELEAAVPPHHHRPVLPSRKRVRGEERHHDTFSGASLGLSMKG